MLPRDTGGGRQTLKRGREAEAEAEASVEGKGEASDEDETPLVFTDPAKMAAFFVHEDNLFLRLNNIPTSMYLEASRARLFTLGGKGVRQHAHNKAMAAVCAHVTVKNKKSGTQVNMGPNLSSATTTRQYACTLNGGCSSMEQVQNANDLALAVSRMGDDFLGPHGLKTLNLSLSGTLPYTVDIVAIRRNDSFHWNLTLGTFSGVTGKPPDCHMMPNGAKVTIYRSGKFIISGGLTLAQFDTLLRSMVRMLKGGFNVGPCYFEGINLVHLQELICMQKGAIIFSSNPGSGMPQRHKLFGPGRVALFTPRAEVPGVPMPEGRVETRKRLRKSCEPGGASHAVASAMRPLCRELQGTGALGLSPAMTPKLAMMPPGGAAALAGIITRFYPRPPSKSKCPPKAQIKNRERVETCKEGALRMGEWASTSAWANLDEWHRDTRVGTGLHPDPDPDSGAHSKGGSHSDGCVVGVVDDRDYDLDVVDWHQASGGVQTATV